MRKKWVRWWRGRSRRFKIVLNLCLSGAAVFALWALNGCPLPTTQMEFRRLERQNLMPESEIVFLSEGEDAAFVPLEGPELVINGRWAVGRFGTSAAVAYLGEIYPWRIWEIPLEEDGTTVLPLAFGEIWDANGYWVEEGPVPTEEGGGYRYVHHNFVPVLLLDVPAETGRAELSVEDGEGGETAGDSWPLEGGIWLAGLPAEGVRAWDYLGSSYTLRLYDRAGGLLLERSGTLPVF